MPLLFTRFTCIADESKTDDGFRERSNGEVCGGGDPLALEGDVGQLNDVYHHALINNSELTYVFTRRLPLSSLPSLPSVLFLLVGDNIRNSRQTSILSWSRLLYRYDILRLGITLLWRYYASRHRDATLSIGLGMSVCLSRTQGCHIGLLILRRRKFTVDCNNLQNC